MDERIQRELEIIKESVLNAVPAEAIYLFGSYAYGTPTEDSDLDIYVVVPETAGDLVDIGAAIRKESRHKRTMPMDLLVGRSSVFNRRKDGPTLERTIAQKGVSLHGY
ncbi:MAG: nucleotidyltransferase domain-containing protein [Clostridiales bacterium]|nr:nucleotidyltransferase domain-containing protein [Clostridiales bacterium]